MPRDLTRRGALGALTAASAALVASSAPVAALAAPAAPLALPDAVLIVHAAVVVDLAQREHAAVSRRADLEDALDGYTRPDERSPQRAAEANAIGLVDCEAECNALFRALEAAADRLTTMRPRTVAGLAAKARAWTAVDRGGSRDEWSDDLARSLAADAIAIGGQADA